MKVKRLIAFILVFVLLFCFAGCTDKTAKETKGEKNPSSVNPDANNDKSDTDKSDTAGVDENDNNGTEKIPVINHSTKTVIEYGGMVPSETYIEKIERDFGDESDISNSGVSIPAEFTLEGDKTIKDELKLGKYRLVWSDEFNGDSYDSDFWQNRITTASSDVYYSMDGVSVSNGVLKSVSTRYYSPYDSTKKWKTAYSISTSQSMVYQYGYLEMRAKVPYKQGAWPSFWLNGDSFYWDTHAKDVNAFAEVDVFEIVNTNNKLQSNLHLWYENGEHIGKNLTGFTFTNTQTLPEEYHVYGFEWGPDELSMYLDGKKYCSFHFNDKWNNGAKPKDAKQILNQPLAIILGIGTLFTPGFNVDKSGTRLDQGSTLSDMPFEYCVDWIRLYQEPGVGGIWFKK